MTIYDETKLNDDVFVQKKTQISQIYTLFRMGAALEEIVNAIPTVPTVDDALSTESENPVQNKVITTALNGKQASLTFDATPTDESTNPVTSGGVYTALAGKQGTLTFDDVPTADSANVVSSGVVYAVLDALVDAINTACSTSLDIDDIIATLIPEPEPEPEPEPQEPLGE